MSKGKGGMNLKKKVIVIASIIALGLIVFSTSFSVIEEKAPFIKNCNWAEERIRLSTFPENKDSAMSTLRNYTNSSGVHYVAYPLDYKCASEQFYFEDKENGVLYFVCNEGLIIKATASNCSYAPNFSAVTDAPRVVFQNR